MASQIPIFPKEMKIISAPTKLKSAVWTYFGFAEVDGKLLTDKTICNLCKILVSYSKGNTSQMSQHLKRHHENVSLESSRQTQVQNQPNPGNPLPVFPPPNPVSKLKRALSAPPTCTSTSKQQRTLPQTLKDYYPPGSPRSSLIDKSIGKFIAADMRPYSVVENPGFKNLVKTMDPRYQLRTRKFYSDTIIPDLYKETRGQVEKALSLARSIALTTDGWTSRATHSFMTITAHFINNSWGIENYVLQTRELPVSHTGVNVASILTESKHEWKLARPLLTIPITTDNASNMGVAGREANMTPHIFCLAHTLNLASQRAMKAPAMAALTAKVRKIVSFFNHSAIASHLLTTQQKLLQVPVHKLIQDVQTRWNSTYQMLDRYLEQQTAVAATLSLKDVRKGVKDVVTLTEDDISNCEVLVDVLKPMLTITNMLCDQQHPTVSIMLPTVEVLKTAMQPRPQTDSELVATVKAAIVQDLLKRYTDPSVSQFLWECSAVDPRFKQLPQISDVKRDQIFDKLVQRTLELQQSIKEVKQEPKEQTVNDVPALPQLPQLVEGHPQLPQLDIPPQLHQTVASLPMLPHFHKDQLVPQIQTPAQPVLPAQQYDESSPRNQAESKSAMATIFQDVYVERVVQGKSPLELIQTEVDSYRNAAAIAMDADPLLWWKVNEYQYPRLAEVARVLLGIPATSVPSERVFSTAGDIVTAQRAQLKPEAVDILVFLKKT